MTKVLAFMVEQCSFLWDNGRYRIVDSVVAPGGGDAIVLVASPYLRMKFLNDRGLLFLQFQESSPGKKSKWYSVDLISRLLGGETPKSTLLDELYISFVRERLLDIESLFDSDRLLDTQRRLNELQKIRSKERFG